MAMRYAFIIFLVVMTIEYLAKHNFMEEGFILAYSFERLQSATQTGGSMMTGGPLGLFISPHLGGRGSRV